MLVAASFPAATPVSSAIARQSLKLEASMKKTSRINTTSTNGVRLIRARRRRALFAGSSSAGSEGAGDMSFFLLHPL